MSTVAGAKRRRRRPKDWGEREGQPSTIAQQPSWGRRRTCAKRVNKFARPPFLGAVRAGLNREGRSGAGLPQGWTGEDLRPGGPWAERGGVFAIGEAELGNVSTEDEDVLAHQRCCMAISGRMSPCIAPKVHVFISSPPHARTLHNTQHQEWLI
jgi:hypothetical protein